MITINLEGSAHTLTRPLRVTTPIPTVDTERPDGPRREPVSERFGCALMLSFHCSPPSPSHV